MVLPYSGLPAEMVFPEALIQPIMRGLVTLIGFDKTQKRLEWIKDPMAFIQKHMNDLVKPIPKAFIDTYNCAPDLFGKDKHAVVYDNVLNQFRRFLT
jgi:hypothetical protein